jgi:hypothetical protein
MKISYRLAYIKRQNKRKGKKMKKILILALCLMLAFSCVACNGNTPDNNGNNSNGNTANNDFDTNKITFASAYAKAQSLGFEGTLDEFIELISGKDGANGKDGENGTNGYTPIKGVDYFTEDDKVQLVNAVLDSLNNADEVSY